VIQPEFLDLPAQRISVNPQSLRGLRAVAFIAVEQIPDEPFLELIHRIDVRDSMLYHLIDE